MGEAKEAVVVHVVSVLCWNYRITAASPLPLQGLGLAFWDGEPNTMGIHIQTLYISLKTIK